jgi:hypothetical protein
MDEIARHRLWSKADEILGEEDARVFMELYRPAYEALMARQAAGEATPPLVSHLSPRWDRLRHRLWRKLDDVFGSENAVTMMELWDEAQRQHMGIVPAHAA